MINFLHPLGLQDSVVEDTNSSSYSPPLSTQKLLDLNMGKEQNLILLEVFLDLIIKLDNLSATFFEGATVLILQINY